MVSASLEELERRAAALEEGAEAAIRHYDRTTWIRFALVFIPVPLVVVSLRLQLEAWGYYLAGGLIVVAAAVLFRLDGAARAKRDRAIEAAAEARRLCMEGAHRTPG